MAKSSASRNLRRQVAVEAARLMLEQGVPDYMSAKKKAAQRLGLTAYAALPTNVEIEQALLENQRLFGGPDIEVELSRLRHCALSAMEFLSEFRPRLVGAVVSGAITMSTVVELHLFSDSAESMAIRLINAQLDYRLVERRVRTAKDTYQLVPTYSFSYEDVDIDALVFEYNGERQPPLCPINGKPILRIAQAELERLIDRNNSDSVVDGFFA